VVDIHCCAKRSFFAVSVAGGGQADIGMKQFSARDQTAAVNDDDADGSTET